MWRFLSYRYHIHIALAGICLLCCSESEAGSADGGDAAIVGKNVIFDGEHYLPVGNCLWLGDPDLDFSISFSARGAGPVLSTERTEDAVSDVQVYISGSGHLEYTVNHLWAQAPYVITARSTGIVKTSEWNTCSISVKGSKKQITFSLNGKEETHPFKYAFSNGHVTRFRSLDIGRHRNYTWGTRYFTGDICDLSISSPKGSFSWLASSAAKPGAAAKRNMPDARSPLMDKPGAVIPAGNKF
jgi:hypothetical protein